MGVIGRIWTEDEDARILAMRSEGATWDDVGEEFGINRATARRHGLSLGLPFTFQRDKRGNPSAVSGEQLLHMAVVAFWFDDMMGFNSRGEPPKKHHREQARNKLISRQPMWADQREIFCQYAGWDAEYIRDKAIAAERNPIAWLSRRAAINRNMAFGDPIREGGE